VKKVAVVDVPDFLFVLIDGRMEKRRLSGTAPGFREGMPALCGGQELEAVPSDIR
jgi:hypothetical protein